MFRGALRDVASRFLAVASQEQLDGFVRINGDSPLLDTHLIEEAISIFKAEAVDLVTNVSPRTFPPGQSVEVVRVRTFERAYARYTTPPEFEHVTYHFYQHPEQYTIRNFSARVPYAGMHLAVDTQEDEARLAAIIRGMKQPHWMYALPEIASLYRHVEAQRKP